MRNKYKSAKSGAKRRGVEWQLTFEQWRDWWLATGHWHERGCRKGQYVMARFGDKGPYALDNIKCITHAENTKEGRTGKQHYDVDWSNLIAASKHQSPAHKAAVKRAVSFAAKNKSPEHREKLRQHMIRMNEARWGHG